MSGAGASLREAAGRTSEPNATPTPRIRKILFPVDFRYTCYGTARYLEALAGHFNSRIMLLHAAANPQLLASQKLRLASFLAADLRYYETERVCVAGDAAGIVEETTHSWEPDLLMLPSHGLGFIRRRFVGSVTARVLRDLRCPIWTSTHGEDAPPVENIRFRKVLCALGLGEHSVEVLRWASWFVGEYRSELGIVHALDPTAVPQVFRQSEESELDLTRRLRAQIDELAGKTASMPSRVFIIPGTPALACARAAVEFGAELLVIGRHKVESVPEDLIDHVFSIVGASPCPVVIV